MNRFSLNGNWDLSGADIKTIAEIPGDFHTALLKNNYIKDPFYGFNEQDALWIGRTDWTIERTFNYIKTEGYRSILEFSQADTFFTLYVNGIEAGKGQNAFIRYRFDITDSLKNGENTIKMLFESPEKKNKELYDKLPYPVPEMRYDVYSPHRNMSRKCQCNGGWDWGPCLMVSGIYEDIFIEQIKDGLFDYVKTGYSSEGKKWTCNITVEFDSLVDEKRSFRFEIKDENNNSALVHTEKEFLLHKGKNLLTASLNVENPWIWKTSGELKEMGIKENRLYDLTVCTDETCITKKIAFNCLKAVSEKDFEENKEGRSIYFENNGRKIFAKGSNWIPVDSLPSRFTYERYYDLLKSAVDANQNCIRVWGGGYYEKEIFYEICDRLGIILWQDMMFACSLYPMTKDFLNEVSKEIDYQITRLQPHACIGLWCGNNENYGALNWFKESNENRVRYLVDYDRLYNGLIGTKIREIDPSRIFWPSSPCSGPDDFADNWHSDNMGDMHYWSVWHERKDKEAYQSIRPRFVSEFGYESFPSLNCIKSFAEKKDWNFTSRLMEYHQRSPSGNSIILENFSRYFKFPGSFENMIYLSQVQQAVAIKTAVDWWRSLKPHCMGSIVWQLNDIWPGPSWSSLEYDGKWKLLHYEEKKFFENVYMPLFIKDGKLNVTVCNDEEKSIKGQIKISYLDYKNGKEICKPEIINFNVKGDETKTLFEKPVTEITEIKTQKYFIFAVMNASDGKNNLICENTVFPSVYKHSEIAETTIKADIKQNNQNCISITLTADKPAFFVSLDTLKYQGRFSDNNITLLPGTKKEITFTAGSDINFEDFEKDLKIYSLDKASV